MLFKLNDHVRVKPGVLLQETEEPVPGWEGQITEVPTDPNALFYLIELDAPSLAQLPEKYLADCIEKEETPVVYYFGEEDLEPASRRDTDAERRQAQERVEAMIFPPEDDELDNAQLEQWLGAFEQSPHFAALAPGAQESARAIVEMFSEYAFNYRGNQPADWTVETMHEVCLELFPRKFTAEIEHFEQIGPALSRFFEFLAANKYQKNAAALRREAEKITPEIVRRAKDPRNWGMAKSFAMRAMDAGVELTDEKAMDGFMASYNAGLLGSMDWDWPETGPKKPERLRPAQENPFKNISRNEVVKVKYPDGNIREGKFKRLEEDLRAGKCELLR